MTFNLDGISEGLIVGQRFMLQPVDGPSRASKHLLCRVHEDCEWVQECKIVGFFDAQSNRYIPAIADMRFFMSLDKIVEIAGYRFHAPTSVPDDLSDEAACLYVMLSWLNP
jgi:hypothetical protein